MAASNGPISLRDATLADADLLVAWGRSPEAKGEFNEFGIEPDGNALRDTLAAGPLRNEGNGQLIVERVADGQPIGTVAWHEIHYGPPPKSRAWNIGISLIPEARGHGYGGIAQRLLADYLFKTTDANRVEASTDVENLAEQRALEKAGFVCEGIQRRAQFRAGSHHDLVTYSRLRDDP